MGLGKTLQTIAFLVSMVPGLASFCDASDTTVLMLCVAAPRCFKQCFTYKDGFVSTSSAPVLLLTNLAIAMFLVGAHVRRLT
jgi:hypothetical protein